MEALLSAMSSLSRECTFPCMPFVAYAVMKGMDFLRHTPEKGEVIMEAQRWVLPDFSMCDFYMVPRDFLTASFVFLGSIPECKVAVQSLQSAQSAPSMMELQRRMAPDRHTQFLLQLQGWLAAGRTTVRHTDLSQWDRMGLSVPFWKDPDFCQQEMHFQTDNTNMVQQRQNKET